MKKILNISLFQIVLLISTFTFKTYGNTWEWSMLVTSNGSTPVSAQVYLYRMSDVSSGLLTPYRYVSSLTYNSSLGLNFICDIEDNNTTNPAWAPITNGNYYLRINNRYTDIEINNPPGGNAGDFTLVYNTSTQAFTVVSNQRVIGITTTTQSWTYTEVAVTVGQKLSDNSTSVGTLNRWQSGFTPLTLGATYQFSNGSTQTLLGDQAIYSNQKYNNWNTLSDVTNHHSFTITSDLSQLTSNFKTINNATLQAQLIDNNAIDTVSFKDQWLIDYTDSYGIRNQGMSAPFKSVVAGSYNLGTGTAYKGIFLDQEYNPNDLNSPHYSVSGYSTKTIGGVVSKFLNWSASGADITNASSAQTPVIFRSSGATVTANYKGSLASNASTAMNNPSQRKIVRGNTGNYFLSYESAGKIWVEYSTNEGTTWQLANGSQALGYGITPSITPYYNGALVTYGNPARLYYVSSSGVLNYDEDAGLFDEYGGALITPVVSFSEAGDFIVLWRSPYGIHYSIGYRSSHNHGEEYMNWFVNSATLSGSNSNSYTPTVDCKNNVFQIAWKQGSGSSSSICYTPLTRQTNGTYTQGTVQTMSSGYPLNYSPSIIATTEPGARMCWISDDPEESSPVTIFHDPGYYYYWYFGWYVTSAHINNAPGNYAIGWANGDGSHQYTIGSRLSNPQALTTTGNYVQIANSSSSTTMRSLGFNTGSTPYRFNLSSTIPLYKSGSEEMGRGRGGIITANDAQFLFLLGDVNAGNEKIEFVEMPDTVKFKGTASLNTYLETKPFTLNDNTPLSYNVQYWTRDSATAVAALAENKNVTFRVELVDTKTNAVIGVYNNCIFSSANVAKQSGEGYEVDSKGIGSKTVKLRLVVQTNTDAKFAIVNKVSNGSILGKKQSTRKQITFNGLPTVTSYAIEQNYPNPFNPTTLINYALPKAGNVSLKVYDVLGKEVATLVNEYKGMGSYTVEFDGSKLSSGIYIYKLTSDKFTDVKKMILVK